MRTTILSSFDIGILFGVAGLAGFVDSIAGGGGIITVPALLAVGLPPHLALGTNKLQSSFGSLTAALNYRRGGMLRFRELATEIGFTAMGALSGTVAVQLVEAGWLAQLIPLLPVLIFLYVLFNPNLGAIHRPQRLAPNLFYGIFGCLIGFKAVLQVLEACRSAFEKVLGKPQLLGREKDNLLERKAERAEPEQPGCNEPRKKKRRPKGYGWLQRPRHVYFAHFRNENPPLKILDDAA